MLKIKLQNFQKLLKQKRCGIIHLHVPNLLQFHEKIPFRVKKMQKTVKTMHVSNECNKYEFFAFFHLKLDFFCENEASLEHLNVLSHIFFVSEVFGNFEVLFSTFICELINFQTQFSNPV